MTKTAAPIADTSRIDDLIAAVDHYLETVAGRIREQTQPGLRNIDITDLDKRLLAVASKVDAASVDAGIAAVHTIIGDHCDLIRNLEASSSSIGPMQAAMTLNRLGSAYAAFDRGLTTFDRQGELDTAKAALSAVETELGERLAELESAVEGADLDAVLSLRPVVEVELPGRIGSLKADVLDLVAARAEAEAVVPTLRQSRLESQVAAADTAVEAARQALADAEVIQRGRAAAHLQAEATARAAATTRDQARAAAQDYRDTHAREQKQRLRALAGLPALTDDAAPVEDSAPAAPTGPVIHVDQLRQTVNLHHTPATDAVVPRVFDVRVNPFAGVIG